MTFDVVFFELRGRRCALPVSVVREVLALPPLTPVPLAPPAVRGVAPIHGQVLPIIDLGVWFTTSSDQRGEAAAFRGASDKVFLLETTVGNDAGPVRAVLAVDRIMRLGVIDDEHSRPPPGGPRFVAATVLDVDGPALLLDAERALDQVRESMRGGVRA